jgi:murein DD-endopeptidase MepM/ murein hydrolase activator NlpD
MDIRRAERHFGAVQSIGNRGKPDRSEAESSASTFPHLLAEAGDRADTSPNTPGITATDRTRVIRIVRAGDTLSHLVRAALREVGMPASAGALYRAVDVVAEANRLRDPNRIRPGQAIDLSAVVPGAKGDERNAGLLRDDMVAGVSESAAGILRGLKAFMQSTAGRFTSSFGPRTDPVTGLRAFHTGVDIKMPAGSLIYPAGPGRVIFSGRTLGYGNLIVLAHAGGLTTSYGHNASNLIPAGVVVDRETPIAVVGATGRATGPHLHFELRKDGRPIDPNMGSVESGEQREG